MGVNTNHYRSVSLYFPVPETGTSPWVPKVCQAITILAPRIAGKRGGRSPLSVKLDVDREIQTAAASATWAISWLLNAKSLPPALRISAHARHCRSPAARHSYGALSRKARQHVAAFPEDFLKNAPVLDGFLGIAPMPICAVALALRRPAFRI